MTDPARILTDIAVFCAAVASALLLLHALRAGIARHRLRFTAEVGTELAEAFVFVSAERLWRLTVGAAVTAAAAAVLAGTSLLGALAAATLAGVAPPLAIRVHRSRRRTRLREQFPDALMLMAASLRAGQGLAQAVAATADQTEAPVSQELDLLMRAARVGTSIEDGLEALAARHPLEEVMLLRAAIGVSSRAGGGLAESLDGLAGVLRATLAVEAKVEALTAQGRLQAAVMAALPPALAFLLLQVDPDAMRVLVDTTEGRIACAAVAVLDLLGYLWIRRIVRIDP